MHDSATRVPSLRIDSISASAVSAFAVSSSAFFALPSLLPPSLLPPSLLPLSLLPLSLLLPSLLLRRLCSRCLCFCRLCFRCLCFRRHYPLLPLSVQVLQPRLPLGVGRSCVAFNVVSKSVGLVGGIQHIIRLSVGSHCRHGVQWPRQAFIRTPSCPFKPRLPVAPP